MKRIILLLCHDNASVRRWINALYIYLEGENDAEIHIMLQTQIAVLTKKNFHSMDTKKLIPILNSLAIRSRIYGYADTIEPGKSRFEVILTSKMLTIDKNSIEMLAAVYRLDVWHFANIYVIREKEQSLPETIPDWFKFSQIKQFHISEKYWSGIIGMFDEDKLFMPLTKFTILTNVQRKFTVLSSEYKFHISPIMEVLNPVKWNQIPLGFCCTTNQFRGEMPFECPAKTKELFQMAPYLCRVAYSTHPPDIIPDPNFPSTSYTTKHWEALTSYDSICIPQFHWRVPFGYVYFLINWSQENNKIDVMEIENILELSSQLKSLDCDNNSKALKGEKIDSMPNQDDKPDDPSLFEFPSIFDASSLAMIRHTNIKDLEQAFTDTGCKQLLIARENENNAIFAAKRKSGKFFDIKSYKPLFVESLRQSRSSLNSNATSSSVQSQSSDINQAKSVTYFTVDENDENMNHFILIKKTVKQTLQEKSITVDDERFNVFANELFNTVLSLYKALPTHLLNAEKIIKTMAEENIERIMETNEKV